jgi:hypothetical protein
MLLVGKFIEAVQIILGASDFLPLRDDVRLDNQEDASANLIQG